MSAQHTPGPWKSEALGGCSTVICLSNPRPDEPHAWAYGLNPQNGYCIARPFTDEVGVRHDFVCFGHADARLVAAAPDLLVALRGMISAWDRPSAMGTIPDMERARSYALSAIAKAIGQGAAP